MTVINGHLNRDQVSISRKIWPDAKQAMHDHRVGHFVLCRQSLLLGARSKSANPYLIQIGNQLLDQVHELWGQRQAVKDGQAPSHEQDN